MCTENQTMVTEFLLLGFQNLHNLKVLAFFFILLAYVVVVIANLLIVILVSTNHQLQAPMFYFLKHLALADLLFTTNIIPNMLHVILMSRGKITTTGCLIQYFIHSVSVDAQLFVLTVMCFDRFMAICQPLRYTSVITPKVCFHLAFWSWVVTFSLNLSESFYLFQLSFCSSNVIDHFFCDFEPFVLLLSSNQDIVEWYDFTIGVLLIFLPFLFIVSSYVYIFIAILKISTFSGRKKAFSTCSTHLATVSTHCGVLVTVYMFTDKRNSLYVNKLRSLLYIIITPVINPLIYTIRNQEFRKVIQLLFLRIKWK